MTFDVSTAYADDYDCFDGVEVVTFTAMNPSPTDNLSLSGRPSYEAHALRYPVNQTGIGTDDLGIEDYDAVFVLWDGDLDEHVPKSGDKLTDADDVDWTAIYVTQRGYEPRWEMRCRKNKEE
jgi:hypothetical protein